MLTFLAIAAKKRLVVDSYDDHAVGLMAKNADGRVAVTEVTLRPKIAFAGRTPDARTLEKMHHLAHEECFIANSVTTKVKVES
jgi:organic hydroperoxide reductase OsmC/OhrA